MGISFARAPIRFVNLKTQMRSQSSAFVSNLQSENQPDFQQEGESMFATNRQRKSQLLVFLVMTMFIITTFISPFSGKANSPALVALNNTRAVAAMPASPLAPVQASPTFDKLLQDNSSNDMLRFNSTTGAYQFSRCSSGYVLTGTATISLRGCAYTLTHIVADRRVQASFDSCANRGTASIQVFAPAATYNITDSNTTNNPGNTDAVAPQIRITAPNGSELIDSGSNFTISWNVVDNVGITRQDVLLSTDGGTAFSTLVQGLAGDVNQYNWIAPLIASTQSVRVRVIAYDAACNISRDDSDANFTILNTNTSFTQVAETPVYMVGSGYRSMIHLFSTSTSNVTVEIGIRNRFGTGLVSLPSQFTLTPGQARAINVAEYLTPTTPPTPGYPNVLMGSIRLRHNGSQDCEVRAVVVVDHNNEDESFTVPFTYLASSQSPTGTTQQSPLYYIDEATNANLSLQNTTNAPVQVSTILHYGTGTPNTPNGNYALPLFTLAAQASAVIDLSQFADQLQGTQWGSITLNTPPQSVVAHTVMRSAVNRLAFSSAFVDPAMLASTSKVISSMKLDYGMNLKSSLMVRNLSATESRNVTVSFQSDNGVNIPSQQISLAAGEQRLIELNSQQLLSANGSTRATAQISYSGNAGDVIGNAVSMSSVNSCAIPAQLVTSVGCDSGRRLVSPFFRFDERTSGILQLTNFGSNVVKAGATMKFADTTLPTLNTDLITIPAGGTVAVDLQSYFSLVDDGVAAQGALEVFHNGAAGSVSGTFTALGKHNDLSLPVVLEGAPALAANDMRLFPNAKELQPSDSTEVAVLTGGNLGSPVWSVSSTTGNPGSITPLASTDTNIYRASYVASSDPNTLTVALKADATSSSGGIKTGDIILQKVKVTEFSSALGRGRLDPKANTAFTLKGNIDFPNGALDVRFRRNGIDVFATGVSRNASDPKLLTGIAPPNIRYIGDAQIVIFENGTKISKDKTDAAYYAFNPPSVITSVQAVNPVGTADGFNRLGGILNINGAGFEVFNDIKPEVDIDGIGFVVNSVTATPTTAQLNGRVQVAQKRIRACGTVSPPPCKTITVKNPGARKEDKVTSNPLYNLKPGPAPVPRQRFPDRGASIGDNEVTITGGDDANFLFVNQVTIGGTNAFIVFQSNTNILILTPPHTAGAGNAITLFDIDGAAPMGVAVPGGTFTYELTPPRKLSVPGADFYVVGPGEGIGIDPNYGGAPNGQPPRPLIIESSISCITNVTPPEIQSVAPPPPYTSQSGVYAILAQGGSYECTGCTCSIQTVPLNCPTTVSGKIKYRLVNTAAPNDERYKVVVSSRQDIKLRPQSPSCTGRY
jgi:hypothetical protein